MVRWVSLLAEIVILPGATVGLGVMNVSPPPELPQPCSVTSVATVMISVAVILIFLAVKMSVLLSVALEGSWSCFLP